MSTLNMAFGLSAVVAILVGLGCSDAGQASSNSVKPSSAVEANVSEPAMSPTVVDLGVATMTVPPEWQWIQSGGSGFGGILVPRGTKNPNQTPRLIQVHVGEKQLDLDESANSLAKKFAGSVSELPFQIDGERALRIAFKPEEGQMLPHEGLGVVRGSMNLLFLSASKETDESIWPKLQEIVTTLKWTGLN